MTKHVWRKCLECDDFAVEFNFYNPDAVYCEGCGQQIGATDQGTLDSLTLSERVADELIQERESDTTAEDLLEEVR